MEINEEKLYTLSEARLIFEKEALEKEIEKLKYQLSKEEETCTYWREEYQFEIEETSKLNKTIDELIAKGDMFGMAVEENDRNKSFLETLSKWNKTTARIAEERKNSVINVVVR